MRNIEDAHCGPTVQQTFDLHGERLKGRWHLVRLRGNRPGDAKRENWLLIKGKDEFADKHGDAATRRNIKRASSAIARWKLLPKGPDEAGERRGRKRRAVLTYWVVPRSVTRHAVGR